MQRAIHICASAAWACVLGFEYPQGPDDACMHCLQMCRALAHIHGMGVCHRDIKPQNLLVNTHTHQLKLCDFGSAKVACLRAPCRPLLWLSPLSVPHTLTGARATQKGRWLLSLQCLYHLTLYTVHPSSAIGQLPHDALAYCAHDHSGLCLAMAECMYDACADGCVEGEVPWAPPGLILPN